MTPIPNLLRAPRSSLLFMVLGCIAGTNSCPATVNVGIGTTNPVSPLTVNGTVTATAFVGNGSGLTNITATTTNATQLGGLAPSAFAQVGASNTFAASQTINGTVTAASFVGNGSGLTNITASVADASELGGLPARDYAQLAATNSFSGNQATTGNLAVSGTTSSGTVNAKSGFNISGSLFASGSTVSKNAFLGFAGNTSTTGIFNIASGIEALYSNTTGDTNTANGIEALSSNTTGSSNTASGAYALQSNTMGSGNTVSVTEVLLSNTTGSDNTANGSQALYLNTTGSSNTASGIDALFNNTAGNSNTGLGDYAGQTNDGSGITGSNNTALGASTTFGTGSISNATAIGANAEVTESNTTVLGCVTGTIIFETNVCPTGVSVGIATSTPDSLLTVNGSADKPGGGSWGTYSDMRLKTVNGGFGGGLNQVMQLRPIRYRYKPDNAMGIRDSEEHVGVVAQEVQRVIPEAVTENSKGYLIVNNDPVIWSMVNAIKEQQKEIEQQRANATQQEAEIAAQQKLIREQSHAMRTLMAEVREIRKALRKVKAQTALSQPVLVAAK